MAVKTWKAVIRLKSGGVQDVRVQADNHVEAKELLEMQYGKGCVWRGPTKVR